MKKGFSLNIPNILFKFNFIGRYQIEIRKATSNDINELASLMEQLAYQTSIEQMKIRFNNIEATPNHYTLVAC